MSAGMRTYVRELVRRVPQLAPDVRFLPFGTGDNFGLDEQLRLPLAIARMRPRLVHFPAPFVPLLLPKRFVITIHDLIELEFPQYSKPHAVWYYRNVIGRAARRARAVITDDERTRALLIDAFRLQPARVRVIALGATAFAAAPAAAPRARPYLLYAGNHRPHKDLPTLFAAWHALPAGSGVDLVLTGRDDFNGSLERYRRDDARIDVIGDVPEVVLAALYAGALAYVHPALSEGFGLPMLEAMLAGAPVIASENAIPRVLHAHAVTYPAGDSSALRAALERALVRSTEDDLRLGAARRVAQTLTWERCAQATIGVYRDVMATR